MVNEITELLKHINNHDGTLIIYPQSINVSNVVASLLNRTRQGYAKAPQTRGSFYALFFLLAWGACW